MKLHFTTLIVMPLVCSSVLLGCSSGATSKKKEAVFSPPVPVMMAKKDIRAPLATAAIVGSAVPEARENYQQLLENPTTLTSKEPVSTFSIDVDTGSYANVRRHLRQGKLPPVDAVRVEEMINYFPYASSAAKGDHPFSVDTEVAPAPWNLDHQLLRVRIQAHEKQAVNMPPANLVFLVDVSGSMNSPERLPLVQNVLTMLTKKLRKEDRITLVVYAGRTAVELEPTPGDQQKKIIAAIERLQAEGSTAGESAIKLAYAKARESFIPNGINRILMATDGDFNVGLSDINQLKHMIEDERKSGVSLSMLGVGEGNYNEYLMEQMADVGNGNYSYLDSADEGRKVLLEEMSSTFNTVAADVKIQLEFNPSQIAEYRLIGYENRKLNEQDFNNDKVDAGEIGAGKTVTALYELTPVGKPTSVDPHRYQAPAQPLATIKANELGFLRIRYKKPNEDKSILLEEPVLIANNKNALAQASDDFRFAASVASFGMRLHHSQYLANYSLQNTLDLAKASLGKDDAGYRREFVRMVELADAKLTSQQ